MVIKKQFIPKERTKQRPGIKLYQQYSTIHSTGNACSTAQNEADFVCYNSKRKASFHFVCDEKEVIQVLPENEVAFHAGDGKNGTGNRKSLAIEICESGNRKKAVDNAVMLTREIMKKYHIPLEKVVPHYHWAKKNCPRILIDKSFVKNGIDWDYFTNRLKEKEIVKVADIVYNTFEEVPEYWRKQIKWCYEKGIFNGTASGKLDLDRHDCKALVFLYNYHHVKEGSNNGE